MKRFAPPCFRCLLPILDDHMSAFGHDWHQQCFVCHVSVNFFHAVKLYIQTRKLSESANLC